MITPPPSPVPTANPRHGVFLTLRRINHRAKRRDDGVEEGYWLAVKARWNALAPDDRAVLIDDPDLDGRHTDVDRACESHSERRLRELRLLPEIDRFGDSFRAKGAHDFPAQTSGGLSGVKGFPI